MFLLLIEGGMRVTEVRVGQGESIDEALKRFKRKCQRNGIISEMKRREHYEKPSVKRKRKALAAKKRAMKRLRKLMERS